MFHDNHEPDFLFAQCRNPQTRDTAKAHYRKGAPPQTREIFFRAVPVRIFFSRSADFDTEP